MIYSTDKSVAIRAIEESDLPVIQGYRNSSKLRQYFREYRELSSVQINNWYQNMIKDQRFEMFCIHDCDLSETVGVCGITYIDFVNRHGDVHFYIGKEDAWIDDYYSPKIFSSLLEYGFNVLNLNKLWAEIYVNDLKKTSFFELNKFTRDAVLRQHYYFEGSYIDSQIFSLLKKEYAFI